MTQDRFNRNALQVIAENKIRQAIEEGRFDRLPGAGRPLPDLDEPYDPDWWVKKWIARERMEQLGRERRETEQEAPRATRRRLEAFRALEKVRHERRPGKVRRRAVRGEEP